MIEPKVITPDIVKKHGLSDEEYQKIFKILGREPNFTELGIFSVMWSEHCSYKSSKIHLKKFPTTGTQVIQGPGENAGVVDIGDELAVVFKMESHNHPSFIEPYQGAATGVGGILRDVFTMGARPVANLNGLWFGDFNNTKTKYLVNGVTAGIAGYGNCMGVPTIGGCTNFDSSYNGNNLVNAFTLGIVKKDKIFKGFASGVGNPVIYVGSKTGRDGIHGATMASEEFDTATEEKRPTVQVGDPFTEKLLLEACLELFKTDYVVGIQDMGAAGLTSSSFEMASRAKTGIEMNLDVLPLREEGMIPYEMMLSESQERMLIVVKKGCENKVKEIFKKWDLDFAIIGKVTDDGIMKVTWKGDTVVNLDVLPLAEEAPVYNREYKEPAWLSDVQKLDISAIPEPENLNEVMLKLIASPNIASKRWIFWQYDHMVRTSTIALPGSDSAVIKIKGTKKAVSMTLKCNSLYCYLDPFAGGKLAVAEAARNLSCSGARPLAITDCLNFGNPEKPEVMWQFVKSIEGIAEACSFFDTPVVSGNVSFYNETQKKGIFPTPTVGMVGLVEDAGKVCTQYFKKEGDLILLAGALNEGAVGNHYGLGGSEYLREIHQIKNGLPPLLNMSFEKCIHEFCRTAVENGLVSSLHDCSEGGISVALAKCCFGEDEQLLGCQVDLKEHKPWKLRATDEKIRKDALLFGESQSRIIISTSYDMLSNLKDLAEECKIPLDVIGTVGGNNFKIEGLIDLPLIILNNVWENAIPNHLK